MIILMYSYMQGYLLKCNMVVIYKKIRKVWHPCSELVVNMLDRLFTVLMEIQKKKITCFLACAMEFSHEKIWNGRIMHTILMQTPRLQGVGHHHTGGRHHWA